MNVQKGLHCSQQESPEQGLSWPSQVLAQIQSDQFRSDTRSFRAEIHIIFCVHRWIASPRCAPSSVVVFWHRWTWTVAPIVELAAFVPRQHVGMQCLPRLSLGAIPRSCAHIQWSFRVAIQEVLFESVCAALKRQHGRCSISLDVWPSVTGATARQQVHYSGVGTEQGPRRA